MRMQENEAGRVDVLIRPRTETEVWLSEEMIYPPSPPQTAYHFTFNHLFQKHPPNLDILIHPDVHFNMLDLRYFSIHSVLPHPGETCFTEKVFLLPSLRGSNGQNPKCLQMS